MKWRTITAKQYVDNDDAEGFDEARIKCPDGFIREVWDAGYDTKDRDTVVIHTSLPTDFSVAASAPIRVR